MLDILTLVKWWRSCSCLRLYSWILNSHKKQIMWNWVYEVERFTGIRFLSSCNLLVFPFFLKVTIHSFICCRFVVLQVCWPNREQRSAGPGHTGAEGVLRCTPHHQHREDHHGVHVAQRSQTSPVTGVKSWSKGKDSDLKISHILFPFFRTGLLLLTSAWHS